MKEIVIDSDPVALRDSSLILVNLSQHPTLKGETLDLLGRMFRDPRVLEAAECHDLVTRLQSAVDLEPRVPELRVLLGMALCVDLQPQEALEQLREATRQAPDCFIARLKLGELLMRLRICDQAAEETHKAAQLASNPYQSDLARKQAVTIRTMLREGIERGGYANFLSRLIPFRRRSMKTETAPVVVGSR
jgi:hypothetical protein